MLTKAAVLSLYANYPNNNQNTVREFVDLIFSLAPPPPGGYLPLAGGTMTGALDMGDNPIVQVKGLGMSDNIVMNNNAIIGGSLQSLLTSTLSINSILFSSPAADQGRLDMVHTAGGARFQWKNLANNNLLKIDENEMLMQSSTKGFYFIASDLAYNNLNKFQIHSNYLQANHQTGDIKLQAALGSLDIATNKLGFFNIPGVVRTPALTASDMTNLAVELAAFPLTLGVINNLRTRGIETEDNLKAYGLFQ